MIVEAILIPSLYFQKYALRIIIKSYQANKVNNRRTKEHDYESTGKREYKERTKHISVIHQNPR